MAKKIYSVIMIHESYIEKYVPFTNLAKAKSYFRQILNLIENYLTKKELAEAAKKELYYGKDTNIQIIRSEIN